MYSDFNIEEFTQQLQNDCMKSQTKKFEKNDIITTYIKNRNQEYKSAVSEYKEIIEDFSINRIKTITPDLVFFSKIISLYIKKF